MTLSMARIDWLFLGLMVLASGLIATLSPVLAAGLVVGTIALIGSLIDPVVGFYLAVGTVLVQELVVLPLGFTLTQLLGAMALGIWLLQGMAQRRIWIEQILLVQWALFLGALILAAGLTEYNTVDALKQVVRWIVAFLAYVITVALVRTPRKAVWLVITILIAGVVEGAIGIQQYLAGAGPFAIGEEVRAYGTIGKPNTFAGFLGMIWPLGLAVGAGLLLQWFQQRKRVELLLAGFAAGTAGLISLAAVGVSFSRGAWVGAAAALVVMAVLFGRRRAMPWLIIGSLGVTLLLVAPDLLPAPIAERAVSITENLRIFDASRVTVTDDNFAIVERMAHWQAGARMFVAHPVVGVGPDNFNRAYPEFAVGRWAESQGHAHNYYIHIAAETGIVGLLTYLLLIGSVGWITWRAVATTRGTSWHAVAIGGAGVVTATSVHNIFENLHVLNFGIHLSAVWGLLAVLVIERGWYDVSRDRWSGLYRVASR